MGFLTGREPPEKAGLPPEKRVPSDKVVHALEAVTSEKQKPPEKPRAPEAGERPANSGAVPLHTEVTWSLLGGFGRRGPGRSGWVQRRWLPQVAPAAAAAGLRTTDRPIARAARGALGRQGCACARRGADPGREEPPRRPRSRHAALRAPLGLAVPSHTEIARFAARLPRLLGRFRLALFRVDESLAEWRRLRPMRLGRRSQDPRSAGGVASFTTDSAPQPMSARPGWPLGKRWRPGRARGGGMG